MLFSVDFVEKKWANVIGLNVFSYLCNKKCHIYFCFNLKIKHTNHGNQKIA